MATLVLIPGLLCDRRLWSDQIAGLESQAQISVADITEQSSLAEMAESVLRAAPELFSLAGFSLGSQVALEIMQTARERVERLALLSATHGGLLPPSMVAFREAVGVIERGDFQQYLDSFYPRYVAERRANDAALRAIFMDMAHAVGPEAGLRQIHVLMSITEPFAKLGDIHCPTIVVGGRDDRRTTPAAHEALAQEIPGAELIMIEDSGHFTTLEQPELVTQALRQWLARQGTI